MKISSIEKITPLIRVTDEDGEPPRLRQLSLVRLAINLCLDSPLSAPNQRLLIEDSEDMFTIIPKPNIFVFNRKIKGIAAELRPSTGRYFDLYSYNTTSSFAGFAIDVGDHHQGYRFPDEDGLEMMTNKQRIARGLFDIIQGETLTPSVIYTELFDSHISTIRQIQEDIRSAH